MSGGHQMFDKKFFFAYFSSWILVEVSVDTAGSQLRFWGRVHPKKVVGFQPYFLKVGAGPHSWCLFQILLVTDILGLGLHNSHRHVVLFLHLFT